MEPRPPGVEGDGIVLQIGEIQWTQKPRFLFPIAVERGPEYLEDLPVPEKIGIPFLTGTQIDLELVMSKALVFCKDHDHILECKLSAR